MGRYFEKLMIQSAMHSRRSTGDVNFRQAIFAIQINTPANYSFTNFFSSSSSDTPFVSGTFVNTQISCKAIIIAKKAKMGHGLSLNMPFSASKKTGVSKVINAAKTQ